MREEKKNLLDLRQVLITCNESQQFEIVDLKTGWAAYVWDDNSDFPHEFKIVMDYMTKYEISEITNYLTVGCLWDLWEIEKQQRLDFLAEVYA